MQRIAAMTVRANGACEAWYNDKRDEMVERVKAEMARQKAAMNAQMDSMRDELEAQIAIERDRADVNTGKRNEFQAKYLDVVLSSIAGKRGPLKRILGTVENAWAMAWAICHCWPEMGETAGMWVDERKEGEVRYEAERRASVPVLRAVHRHRC